MKKFALNLILKLKFQKKQEISSGAPDALSFEHFLPWIWKLVLVYQEQDSVTDDQILPQGASFSKSKRFYKKRNVN